MKVKINNYIYTIEYVNETSLKNTLGTHDGMNKRIEILKGLDKEQQLQTLIHELTHAYLWSYGFCEWRLNFEAMCNFIGTYAPIIVDQAREVLKEWLFNE